jgi:hypothetical protein
MNSVLWQPKDRRMQMDYGSAVRQSTKVLIHRHGRSAWAEGSAVNRRYLLEILSAPVLK